MHRGLNGRLHEDAMISFTLKGQRFDLFLPCFPGQTSTAEGWSRMRWIVAGPGALRSIAIADVTEPSFDAMHDSIEIDDEALRADVLSRGISLYQLEALWTVACDLWAAQLWSEPLETLFNENLYSDWIYPRIQAVEKTVYDHAIAQRRAGDASEAEQFNAKVMRIRREALSDTFVLPSPPVAELVFLILDHVNWLLVERFAQHVNFDRDVGVASLWFGAAFDEFLRTGAPHGLRRTASADEL